jgi:hypothetical protein
MFKKINLNNTISYIITGIIFYAFWYKQLLTAQMNRIIVSLTLLTFKVYENDPPEGLFTRCLTIGITYLNCLTVIYEKCEAITQAVDHPTYTCLERSLYIELFFISINIRVTIVAIPCSGKPLPSARKSSRNARP